MGLLIIIYLKVKSVADATCNCRQSGLFVNFSFSLKLVTFAYAINYLQ